MFQFHIALRVIFFCNSVQVISNLRRRRVEATPMWIRVETVLVGVGCTLHQSLMALPLFGQHKPGISQALFEHQYFREEARLGMYPPPWISVLPPCSTNTIVLFIDGELHIAQSLGYSNSIIDAGIASSYYDHLDSPEVFKWRIFGSIGMSICRRMFAITETVDLAIVMSIDQVRGRISGITQRRVRMICRSICW